ncbi:Hypothetical predicted protein [Mytilus galloprovincialis]|uniref:C2H2-type domain-containing protein n=1 Tax=Mytilus galloprovincialis TaxID=29158 RepID=A0A8B6E1I2_MYTGA|nr:Hypothetical predicted protein [Mytilus galloprovincialis]
MEDPTEDTDKQHQGNEFVQVKEEPLEMDEHCQDEVDFMNLMASTETDTNIINTSVYTNNEAPVVTANSTDDYTEKTLFLCDTCLQPFTNKANLRKHMRIHDKIKPYKCDICGWAFAMKQNMQFHRRIHTGERPHQCSVCGKTFNRSHHVVRHMAIHSASKKQFKCEICALDFHRKDHLQVHMKTHEPPNSRVKMCPYCGKCYKGDKRLENHIKKKHLKEYGTYGTGEANVDESSQLENLKKKRNEEVLMDETSNQCNDETNAEFDTMDVIIKVEPEEN